MRHSKRVGWVWLVATAVVLAPLPATAQSSDPASIATNEGDFEQEGDVRSGTLSMFDESLPDGHDWAGPGDGDLGIIDNLVMFDNPFFDFDAGWCIQSNAHAALLCEDPNWGNRSPTSDDGTQFGGVSNKNDNDISAGEMPWTWNGTGGGPQKNDLTNTYLYRTLDADGDLWLFFAGETRSVNGDSHFDIEWNRDGILVTGQPDGEGLLIGQGPHAGRAAANGFGGDFVISIDFEIGGEQPGATFRRWQPDSGTYAYLSETIAPGDAYIRTITEDEAEAIYGSTSIPGGPWGHFASNGAATATFEALQLVEGAVNLTALNVVEAANGGVCDPANLPFVCSNDATVHFKTRSSQSFTAELKDLVLVPFPLADIPEATLLGNAPDCPAPGDTTEICFNANETTGALGVSYDWQIEVNGIDQGELGDGEDVCVDVARATACDASITANARVATESCCSDAEPVTVSVSDTGNPWLVGDSFDRQVLCDSGFPFEPPSGADECDPDVTIDETPASSTDACGLESRSKTWQATDFCGNQSAVITQSFTEYDDTLPEMSGPGPNSGQCEPPPPGSVTATDRCDPNVDISGPVVESDGQTCPETLTRTWTGTDCSGNSAQFVQTVTVDDTTDPTITAGAPHTIECPLAPVFDTPEASDNCVEPGITYDDVDGRDACGLGDVTRTWTATDDCGNSASDSQTVTVQDTNDPSLVGAPADASYQCEAAPPPVVTATDLCDPAVSVAFSETTDGGVCPETITRTWVATDCAGNEDTYAQTVTVNDTTAPPPPAPGPGVQLDCSEEFPAAETLSVLDNCGELPVAPSVSLTGDSCLEELTYTYSATDVCGNSSSATQTHTRSDTTAPTIDAGPDLNLACGETATIPISTGDDCQPLVTVSGEILIADPYDLVTLSQQGQSWLVTTKASGQGEATLRFAANDGCNNVNEDLVITQVQCGGAGCTPGYWKQDQHFGSWFDAGYDPSTPFCDVFECAFPGLTLLDVLLQPSEESGLNILGFHTVAALLNAANDGVSYLYAPGQVIDMFDEVYPGTKEDYIALKNLFAAQNEMGCPLGFDPGFPY